MNQQPFWIPKINHTLCTGCADCVAHCPTNALEILDDKAILSDVNQCIYCADCELICPASAIEVPYVITRRNK